MNSQYFSKEQVQAGELDSFLKALRVADYGKGDCYNDVHVKPADCGAYVVEWAQLHWSGEEDKGFAFVDYEHEVMLEREMPDGSYLHFFDEQDYENVLGDWLKDEEKEGRIWKRDAYGHWHDDVAEQKTRESFEKLMETENEQI